MNADDFEKQLQRQPIRPVPGEWRGEILSAARRIAVHASRITHHSARSWWREMLWPCPQAWAGLAAIWGVVFFLNVASREPARNAGRQTAPLSAELMMALQGQKRLFAELIGPNPPVEPSKTFVPQPRSERWLPMANA